MSDQAALLKAIKLNMEEDTPRLMYADWLQENGRDYEADLLRWWGDVHGRTVNIGCKAIANNLLDGSTWQAILTGKIKMNRSLPNFTFQKGLITAVCCSYQNWMFCADRIRQVHPCWQVALTGRPAYMLGYQGGYPGKEEVLFCLQGRGRWHKPKRHEYLDTRPAEQFKIAKRLMKIEFPGIRFTYL